MKHRVVIQDASEAGYFPDRFLIQRWVNLVLKDFPEQTEICIRMVGPRESQLLNNRYRNRDKPTNILSFTSTIPSSVQLERVLLGDLVVCTSIVNQEAKAQKKDNHAHWAHIIMHGVLHLLGYDHIKDDDAHVMESLEIKLLAELGYPDPYRIDDDE